MTTFDRDLSAAATANPSPSATSPRIMRSGTRRRLARFRKLPASSVSILPLAGCFVAKLSSRGMLMPVVCIRLLDLSGRRNCVRGIVKELQRQGENDGNENGPDEFRAAGDHHARADSGAEQLAAAHGQPGCERDAAGQQKKRQLTKV